jgi:competence protein ComGC
MREAKLPAFSILEILVALVIIGVMMTLPNWFNLSNKLAKSRFAVQEKLQLEILIELTRQATSPIKSVVRVDLPRSNRLKCHADPIFILFHVQVKFMSNSLEGRFSGFILLDVLIGLSVLSIAIVLYWQSFSAQSEIFETIQQHYSLRRLESDARVLLDIDRFDSLYVSDVSFDSGSVMVNLINSTRVIRFDE